MRSPWILIGCVIVAAMTFEINSSRDCWSQEPEMSAATLAPVQVRVDFWAPERPRSVTVHFYQVTNVNGQWLRGAYVTSLSTRKNGQHNDQVIRGRQFMDGNKYWVQLNYTTASGQPRVYCRVNRGNEGIWFHAGADSTPLQPVR